MPKHMVNLDRLFVSKTSFLLRRNGNYLKLICYPNLITVTLFYKASINSLFIKYREYKIVVLDFLLDCANMIMSVLLVKPTIF